MQALVELIAGLVAMLAAFALASFGVEVDTGRSDREVRRVDCADREPAKILAISRDERRGC